MNDRSSASQARCAARVRDLIGLEIGFPGGMLEDICRSVEHLAEKAIPKSRSKSALARIGQREGGTSTPLVGAFEAGPFEKRGATS
jgi:hypothetical protein